MNGGRELISLVAEMQDLTQYRKENWTGTFEEYLDLVRDDWPATPVNAGPYPVVFDAHVPHDPSYFKAFISRPGWGPDQPLGWDDLELLEGPEDFVRDGALYRFSVAFPPEPAITCCLWFGNGSIRQGKSFSL